MCCAAHHAIPTTPTPSVPVRTGMGGMLSYSRRFIVPAMVERPGARATRALWLLILCLSVTAAAQAPTDLVVVITGSKQFHQPSCPLVARAGSQHVKVMRRSEAIRKGLTAHDCASELGHSTYVDP